MTGLPRLPRLFLCALVNALRLSIFSINPECPHCESTDIVRKKGTGIGRVGHWNCQDCKASFKVTCCTVFHGAKIPLQKWFLAISLILNYLMQRKVCPVVN